MHLDGCKCLNNVVILNAVVVEPSHLYIVKEQKQENQDAVFYPALIAEHKQLLIMRRFSQCFF